MASAIAMMAKRRYEAIVAKQQRLERRRNRFRAKPPESSEDTVVWHWEQEGSPFTVMYNKPKREVWCNGTVLPAERTRTKHTENTGIYFTINTLSECTCQDQIEDIGSTLDEVLNKVAQDSSHSSISESECKGIAADKQRTNTTDYTHCSDNVSAQTQEDTIDTTESSYTAELKALQGCSLASEFINSDSNTIHDDDNYDQHSEDCLFDKGLRFSAVIQEIKVDDSVVYELYVDGYMIQEHSKFPLNYDSKKPEECKKND